jgi:hypothetical protein
MRSKHQVALAASLVAFFCLATACSDDGGGSPSGNEAGESGAGASSGGGGNGSGGKPSAGNGGTMSNSGGVPMGNAGEPAGNGGQRSGEGGTPSTNGGQSSGGDSLGGNPASSGGEPSGAAAGAGGAGGVGGAGGTGDSGSDGCTPLTIAPFDQAQVDPTFAVYVTSFTPNIGAGAADNFRLAVQGLPYDGDKTGTFDLTQNGDDNYQTCARCVLVYADGDQKIFYPSQGTLQIAPGSKPLGGSIDATITNLKLVEVTIASDSTSTAVTNGACLTVASATIQVEAPACGGFECDNGYCVTNADYECDKDVDCPDESDEFPVNVSCDPVWLCDDGWYGDNDCDCGCGIKDEDCAGTTNENECDFCVACQGNTTGGCKDNEVNPANTTQCL